jgi:hypothetical protein
VERDDEDTDETSEGRSGEDADGALTDNSDLI